MSIKEDPSPSRVVQAWMQAFHSGDRAAAQRLLAQDVVLRFESPSTIGAPHIGPAAVFRFFEELAAISPPKGGRPVDLLRGTRFVAELYERRAMVAGEEKTVPVLVLYEVGGGRIEKITYLPTDRATFDQMLGSPGSSEPRLDRQGGQSRA
jgi:limonene-1,2-epoxide hydrolase